MASPTRLFEGKQRTMREIVDEFFPGEVPDRLRKLLNRSKARTKAEVVAWLARPDKRALRAGGAMREAVRAEAADAKERRFSREARAKSDAITGTKGCNYCHRVKPSNELTARKGANGRVRLICTSCSSNRRKALSTR